MIHFVNNFELLDGFVFLAHAFEDGAEVVDEIFFLLVKHLFFLDGILQVFLRGGTLQFYLAHVAYVEHPGPRANGHVFRRWAGILDRHLPSGEFHHSRSHLSMYGAQGCFFHFRNANMWLDKDEQDCAKSPLNPVDPAKKTSMEAGI